MQKKKSLGQHFLHNKFYLNAVADTAHVVPGELLVEIGPGEGALTQALLERGARVIALEKDSRLISLLREKFSGKNFEVVEGDALDFKPPKTYKLVGNIPYYISGALFKKFFSEQNLPERLVFLIQKEVAQRITGHPSTGSGSQKESILSLSVKAYGAPRYIKTVPRGAFSPPPKVDSAILAVENISRKNFLSAAHEKKFFELVKKGFSKKRKFLLNNLGKEHSNILENVGISVKVRAEDVPLAKWLHLSRP
jgi:16S rRNA (adenine1518-N6/adenine1519-N6)-dimethyltransferase